MKQRMIVLILAIVSLAAMMSFSFAGELRKSPVAYRMSFDNRDFFDEDFIEISGKKSIEQRKIDFPEGRYGKGIRMSFIPEPPDADNMSGIDLDLITAVIFNTNPKNTMGYNQPFIWGSGRLNPRFGAVSFWAKGEPPYQSPLFEQTTIAFGRKERDLLGVVIGENNSLSAYLRDARYVRHEIKSNVKWDGSKWNHVVFNWDWANGLELWLNGEKIASSWGQDAWFETLLPGLFHLPVPGLVYDEVFLMDRPLTKSEIAKLMKSNTPPGEESIVYTRRAPDEARIAAVSGADKNDRLPKADVTSRIRFTETWPCDASDGHIPGWYVIDGRNEIAWPHEYSFFTIIPGDADFHAEKVDITTPEKSKVNYVALTGNLTNVRVQSGTPSMDDVKDRFRVPDGDQFFYGSTLESAPGSTYRIPFTESYGPPEGFQGDVVKLPQSGAKRIQNVGLYYVSSTTDKPDGEPLKIGMADMGFDDRYTFAVHSLTARDERTFALAAKNDTRLTKKTVDIGAFSRLNILSEPYTATTGVSEVTLYLPLKTKKPSETLFVRVRDAAVPSRFWNQIALRLDGFDKGFTTLTLTIDFQDIVVTGGDRLWIDLGTAGSCQALLGDTKNPAVMYVATVPSYIAADPWADKEIISARAQYSKMYEFLPWQFTGRDVTLEKPYCYGGPFDVFLPALAIHRVLPEHFVANFMILMSGPDYDDGHPIYPEKHPLVTIDDPHGAPDWAKYMHDFNIKRHAIADWWVKRQNPDGQVGGGWNDDTLFMSFHQADLPLDCNANARAIIDSVHTKFERTGLFKDGYCRIYPIDRMHTGDFISERYNTFVNNIGQAYAAEREMESAWRMGHPDETPVNYAQGIAFRTSVNVFKWYWSEDMPSETYTSIPLDKIAENCRLYTSLLDDYYFFRMTESNVHRDDYIPYGAPNLYTWMLGGVRGARWDAHLKLAVMWPFGGGPDVARVIMKADDTTIEAACYSFDNRTRDLGMRPCRLKDGVYKVGVYADPQGNGTAGTPLWEKTMTIRRFDVVSLPVPPHESVVIKVQRIEAVDRSAALPDLVIDPWDADLKGSSIAATIHNLGNAPAKGVVVRLYDGDTVLQEKTVAQLDAPTDFKAKRAIVTFTGVTSSPGLRVVADPDNCIAEIMEENNGVAVRR